MASTSHRGIVMLTKYAQTIVVSIVVAIVVFYLFVDQRNHTQTALALKTELLRSHFDNRLTNHIENLSALKQYFLSSQFVDRKEFKQFVTPVLKRYPELIALEWIPRVAELQIDKYIDKARLDGLSSFNLKRWEPSLGWTEQTEAWARFYYPVFYVEPMSANLSALGIDLGSHKERWQAIEKARQSGQAVASQLVTLAQGGKGILIFMSLNEGQELDSFNKTQQDSLVLVVLKMSEFIDAVISDSQDESIFFEMSETNYSEKPFFSNVNQTRSTVSIQTSISFLNQQWPTNISASSDFIRLHQDQKIWYLVIAGLLVIAVVFRNNISSNSAGELAIQASVESNRDVLLRDQLLLKSEGRQQAILAVMNDALITIDEDGQIGEFNLVAETMFGYEAKELVGQNIKKLMPESIAQAHDGYLEQYKKSHIPHIIGAGRQVVGLRKNGSTFPLHLSVTEQKTNGTSVFVGVLRDLSLEQELQIEQKNTNRQLQLILDTAREGICGIDGNGNINFANRTAEAMLGYETEGLKNVRFDLFIDRTELESGKESLLEQNILKGKEVYEFRETLRNKAGISFPAEISLGAILDDIGYRVGTVLIFKDNTVKQVSEKKIEEQNIALDLVNENLSKANKDLEQFAYVASHDLKAPLRAIGNLASWITEDLGDALAGDSLNNMALLRSRVDRLDVLLTDLLEYSRAGHQDSESQDINSHRVVLDLVDLQGVPDQIKVTVDDNLPVIHTIKPAFDIVVRNLISNAVKHQEKESGNIRLSCDENPAEYIFSVEDDGPGISVENQGKVFNLFTKLKSRDDVEGSGMGLAICRRAMDRIGGKIWIDQTKTDGARFLFSIPKSPLINSG